MLFTAWRILNLHISGITAVHSCVGCVLTITFALWPLGLSEVRGSHCHVGATPVYRSIERLCVCVCTRERDRSYFPWVRKETDESMLWVWVMGTIKPQNTLNLRCAHTVIHNCGRTFCTTHFFFKKSNGWKCSWYWSVHSDRGFYPQKWNLIHQYVTPLTEWPVCT